ncbi:hypothetical protein ACIBAI_11355 [Streptomyces sp. NPDC051041]|uniref:hypothetical protein n=1 Tax=Streptomyces sp. NPDC051041 TaxID=3365640 RepID=UPI00379581CD
MRLGLVRREADARDGRAVRVGLTERGAALAEGFGAGTCRRAQALPAGPSAAERERPTVLLDRVVRADEAPGVFAESGERRR